MDWYNNSLYYSDMKGDVYVWLLNGTDISENYHIPNIAGAGALAFEWLGHFLYWAGKTYVVIALTLDLSDGLLYWLVQDSQCIHLYTAVLRGQRSAGDTTITEFAAWSTSDISQNSLMYYSGRLFWINGFRIITAQEIDQRTSVSVLEPAKFNQFTIIQTSLKPLPGNFSFTPKVIPDAIPESSFMIEGNASSFQILWNASPAVDWGVIFYSVEFSAHSKFLASEQHSLPVFTVEGLEPYALFNLSVTPYTYWGKGPKTSLSLRAPETEINAFPYLITFFDNKIVLLDMDRNQVVWTLLAEGDVGAMGYTADDAVAYYAQGDSLFLLNMHNQSSSEIFRDAVVFDITIITIDWISRHLYFVLKESQNGMQIFDVDLENKVKYPRKLKICNRNSTIISFSVYPFLSRLYWTEVSDFGSQMFYYSIINQTLHRILQPPAINHPNGRSQCSCNVTEFELSGAMTIDTSDLKKPRIYFVKGQEIWAMDLEGRQCWQVIIMPALLGKMLVSLTVDGQFLYWISTAKDSTQIYQAKKSNGSILSQVEALSSKHILVYSSVLQPFPDRAFLSLASDIAEPTILNATNTSLTIRLPPAQTNLTWDGITSPTPTYLLYYKEVNDRKNSSELKDRMLWKHNEFYHVKASCSQGPACVCNITDLQPYTSYNVRVVVVYRTGENSTSLPESFKTKVWHRRLKNQKTSKEGLMGLINEDKELADLRGLAAGVGLANACYAIHTLPTQEEIESLPAFPREKLTLRLLLGSGAFGEVYEGTAVDILGVGSGETKVAVKTLKKGSTDQEKIEFLKEAHLMSKFNHPNILKQLGVCLLNEPQYIILELMEGGDLLTYLRKARMTSVGNAVHSTGYFHGPLLTLVDLVDLCVDISKGCVYLEQMHFIHRVNILLKAGDSAEEHPVGKQQKQEGISWALSADMGHDAVSEACS
ncbi:hypothetical protein J1605_012264 [Eschrichtius robustus]|uniref:receptor protein-tyrosine kinase n=1 Tax=Eschrichtius robustus TaxID=9764 RepID=A0AB34GHJ6_ESCRO|nr:hypothetical protein J1605_012264 [Eschrichtius robustus]